MPVLRTNLDENANLSVLSSAIEATHALLVPSLPHRTTSGVGVAEVDLRALPSVVLHEVRTVALFPKLLTCNDRSLCERQVLHRGYEVCALKPSTNPLAAQSNEALGDKLDKQLRMDPVTAAQDRVKDPDGDGDSESGAAKSDAEVAREDVVLGIRTLT